MVYIKDGEIVAPGEPICVAEEFMPGENVRLHEDGVVASILQGRVSYDLRRRVVNVRPLKRVEEIKVGDTVLGEVKEVQDKIAITNILSVNSSTLKHQRVAVILPSPRMRGNMKDYVGIGDLVVASVTTIFTGIIGLSIWKPGLGVVYAICNKCSGTLKRVGRTLICTRCGEREKRKIVPYYGNLTRIMLMMR